VHTSKVHACYKHNLIYFRMLVSHLLTNGKQVRVILRRNIGVCAPVLQKATDPVQQLFIDKIREYAKKSR
jgi:F-type H+-transporting ATPase subunit 6